MPQTYGGGARALKSLQDHVTGLSSDKERLVDWSLSCLYNAGTRARIKLDVHAE